METAVLLTGDVDRLKRVRVSPKLERAREALFDLERTCSTESARVFLDESVGWIRTSLEDVFGADLSERLVSYASMATVSAMISPWRAQYPKRWLLFEYVDRIRDTAAPYGYHVERLQPTVVRQPTREADMPRCSVKSILMTLWSEYAERQESMALQRIQTILGLNQTQTGKLFGVTRQAVAQWRVRGVPNERLADISRVEDIANLLDRKLLPERIPQIIRTPSRGLGGRTILQVLQTDGTEPIRDYVETLLSYRPA